MTDKEYIYKEVLKTMSECVVIHEKSGKLVAITENAENVLGIPSANLTTDEIAHFDFVREDGSSLNFSELPGFITLEQGTPFHNFILGYRDQNYNMKWLSIDSTSLKRGILGEQAALISISDVTERKKMENALIQAKEEAEKVNMAKSDFLSKMSHELRTPLNGILGFAQLLEMDESLNEQQSDYVHEILSGGEHLLNIINDILDLSRIETGKLKVSIEDVDLINVINECINIIKPLTNKKNIQIHKKWNLWQNTYVLADPIRLKQILLNLLDNAIKYNQENGEVSIKFHIEGNEQVVHIVNTGVGLATEEYQKVFVPFYRIEGSQEEGTGIGLSLVKQLVQLMGGKISVSSKKGIGSDFCFRLPLPNELKVAVKWGERIQYPVANDRKEDPNVLLYIEDNESNLNLIRSILKSYSSISLLTAQTGEEGLKIAKSEKVDLILLDLNLPDYHGFEVLEILKNGEKTKDIPIIAVSANAIPQDIQRSLKKGFDNYVTKPINVKEFMGIIRDILFSTVTQNIPDYKILSTGPHGETAVSAKTLQLSLKELKKLKKQNFKAAIVMHYISGNLWSRSVVKGLKATFKKMGIEIVAVTDARFLWHKQVADIETILENKPDIIVSIPVDPVSTSSAFQEASKKGVKLLFIDNIPNNLQNGKDYVSVVSSDNYGNSIEAAHIMAEKLNSNGKIGIIYHDADFFATKQRVAAFEKTIRDNYPNIKIVTRGGFSDPNEGKKIAAAMLTKHQDLNGIFTVWDLLAEKASAVARSAGRDDFVITTIDLGAKAALEIAKDGIIKGLGAQMPYHQGVAVALLAGYALLGKEAPPYVAVPALKVTKENILTAWKMVYNEDAPDTIKKYFT